LTTKRGGEVVHEAIPVGSREEASGATYPYREYIVGYYNMGHGLTTPWGNIIIESHAGWVKPVYGPGAQASCYAA
jgi:hypothetical protein